MNEMEKKEKINELLTRGVAAIYPSKEFLEQKLMSNEKLTIYLGIDPTGPTLHIGHAVPIFKLAEFQKLGHKVILLIGDFTAMIGDPTDKMATRVPLTREKVLENAKSYKKQISRLIKFTGENRAELRYNSKWLKSLKFGELHKLASLITVEQLIKRDMFEARQKAGKAIHLHEFMYPLMVGYDSVAMDVDGEVGGNDQTFNMLVGRDLMKKIKNKEKFVITMKLLTDDSGKKMGKTEGNMVALSEISDQMFGQVMSWADGLIISGLELCTDFPIGEIEKIKNKLSGGMNPRDAKIILAEEIVKIYHGKGKAKIAKKNFFATFSGRGMAGDAKEINILAGSLLADTLLSAGVVASKGDFRRLVEEGAVKDAEKGEKISDPYFKIEKNISLKIGKHRFVKIKI